MIARSSIRKVRKTLRRGEPTRQEKETARIDCARRAGFMCELRLVSGCLVGPLRLNGATPLDHGHLCHLKAKRRYGWMESEETGQKHLWGCHVCHAASHNAGGKPVKRKEI